MTGRPLRDEHQGPPGRRPEELPEGRGEERGQGPDAEGARAGEEHVVGVGPWPGPWPTDPRYDPVLLAEGDRRNVVDRYRYWSVEAVRADLDLRRHPLHVAVENWAHDLNIGSIVRTANAFNVEAVHVVGRRRWNRRGAMVTDRYLHVLHHEDPRAFAAWCAERDLPLIGVDNTAGSVPLEGFVWPRRAALLLGQESSGLTPAALAACQGLVAITQYGSTRSLNAAAAGAVVQWSWALQHASAGPVTTHRDL